MTAEIADAVRERVEAAMASPEVAVRIQQRLKVMFGWSPLRLFLICRGL